MIPQAADWRPPRTLIVGLGALGQAIVEAAARRLADRAAAPSAVAFLTIHATGHIPPGLVALPQPAQGTHTPATPPACHAVALALDAGQAPTRRQARQATLAAGDAVVKALVDALSSISRIPQAPTFRQGRSAGPAAELAIYLVASLDDPFASATTLDLAYLCRQLARQRLNSGAALAGLLLLPDTLHDHAPQPAQACAYAALAEIDSTMQPHDGWPARWGDGLQVDGWGPAFDRGCFLIGALNNDGLSLARGEERTEMAAEALVQLALTPLGARCDPPLPPAWRPGQRSQAYGSLGVAAWVYPAEAVVDTCSHRLAQAILAAWLAEPLSEDALQATGAGSAFVEAHHLTLRDLAGALAAGQGIAEEELLRPLPTPRALAKARAMRSAMDDEMARRLEPLATARPAMDKRAVELADAVTQQLATELAPRLDGKIGSLGLAASFLDSVHARLSQGLADLGREAEARWRDMERVDAELARVGQRLDTLGQSLPEATWRQLVATLVRPRRILAALQALAELSQLGPAYAALLLRQSALALEVLHHDLAVQVYESAAAGVARHAQRVASLRQAAAAAELLLDKPLPAPVGAQGFSLEQSALTPESLEELYRSVASPLSDVLADFARTPDRLSGWPSADGDGDDLAGVCLDFARRRCQGLRDVPLEPLLVRTLGPSPQARSEALQALAASASPFLGWDEARLRGDEQQVLHECVVLGLPQGVSTSAGEGLASPLLEGLGEILWAQVIAGRDARRVAVLCAVQGLPLAALAGLEEIVAAYEAENPAELHVFDGWSPAGESSEQAPADSHAAAQFEEVIA